MENLSFYENLFIKADALITNGNISEAKEILEDILSQQPDYSKAHNHMGWIYYNKLNNYDKGIYHYNLAIKFDSKYPSPYINLTYLLIDIGRYEEAKKHIEFSLQNLESPDMPSYKSELGRISENEKDFVSAYKFYNDAKKLALNNQFIDNMNSNLRRIHTKMSFLDRLKIQF